MKFENDIAAVFLVWFFNPFHKAGRGLQEWPPFVCLQPVCPVFTVGPSSTKLYRIDQYQPQLCMLPTRSAWLHKPSQLKIEKPCLAFTGQTAGQISIKLHRCDQYQPQLCMFTMCKPIEPKPEIAMRCKSGQFLKQCTESNMNQIINIQWHNNRGRS